MTSDKPADAGELFSLDEFRDLARAVLPAGVWDFIDGGAGAESTMAANREAFDRVEVLPRMLAGLSTVTTRTSLLGVPAAAPLAVAPLAYHRLVHAEGELASARAAREVGVPFVASTLSSVRLEEIATAGAVNWFQLYWLRAERQVADLVSRAEEHGYGAVILTADVPIQGRRLRDRRNEFVLPPEVGPVNLDDETSLAHSSRVGDSAVAAHTRSVISPKVAWSDLEWLREHTSLPVAVKGILDPRDAVRALECGVDAVVVSNHGGRQLDGAPASIRALPAVVEAVSGRAEVLLDSGVRGGTDALKALALGASGVLVGRPALWGLAARGSAGVAEALALVRDELSEALMLAGCADPAAAAELTVSWPDAPGSRPGV